jgi:hypothetical protein
MPSRVSLAGAMVVAGVMWIVAPVAPAAAQDASALAGQWTLDRAHSEFPTEVGFDASFMAASPVGGADAPSGGGGRGGRGGGGRRAPGPTFNRPDSQDDARRIQQLTAEAKTPSVNLTIAETGSSVSITDDHGRMRTFHPTTGREDIIQLDQVPVSATTTLVEGRLVVTYQVANGREMRVTYWRNTSPTQLVVDTAFVERGATDSIRRVYVPGSTPLAPPSAPATTAAGNGGAPSSPAAPSTSAAAGQSPDAQYKGLAKLGVVVEDLTAQAAGCGLTHDAIDAAVSKSLTGAGLSVVKNVSSDESTYLYVNVITTSTSTLCVSRYDAFLYTNTAAPLPYHAAPVLVQVLLMHKGGLTGGSPTTHADAVIKGLTADVDEFAAKIHDANK